MDDCGDDLYAKSVQMAMKSVCDIEKNMNKEAWNRYTNVVACDGVSRVSGNRGFIGDGVPEIKNVCALREVYTDNCFDINIKKIKYFECTRNNGQCYKN